MILSRVTKALALGAIAVAVSAGAAFAATATTSVNVRTGPGTQYRAIDTLSPGQHVSIIDRSGGWCQVNQAGPDGWVSCRYLTANSGYRDDRYDDPNVSIQLGFGAPFYPGHIYHRPEHRAWPNRNHYPHPIYPRSGISFGFGFGN